MSNNIRLFGFIKLITFKSLVININNAQPTATPTQIAKDFD